MSRIRSLPTKATMGQLSRLTNRMSVKSAGSHSDGKNKKYYTQSEIKAKAIITDVVSLSSTVKSLTLKIDDKRVTFKAGQWVDFFIPGMKIFTGFSMASAPRQLDKERTLQLAVKHTGYAPTVWVHEQVNIMPDFDRLVYACYNGEKADEKHIVVARPGSEVTVQVAGDFFYDPQPGDDSADLLLIAGGVGINPLCSMMRHVADLNEAKRQVEDVYQPGLVQLLYSAKGESELIFKYDLEMLCRENSNMHCTLFVTQDRSLSSGDVVYGRIDRDALSKALQKYSPDRLSRMMCLICGPSKMIDAIEALLLKLGIEQHQIKYEKWW